MKTITDFPHAVIDQPDVGIMMPDGVRLSARIWMPEDAVARPVPAVLEYIPYRKKDGTLYRDELMHPYVAGHGYACVRVDMRGNGDSEGLMEDEYTQQEMDDALAVIDWLSRQPWCSGAVGMMGKSWGGFNCLQAAFNQPPALKAVISVCSTSDRFADDVHFKGGCLLGENIGWGAVMLSFSSRPADPVHRPDWRADWLRRLEHEPFLAPRWASHQSRDAYWKHGSICEDWGRIKVPVMIVGGWADNYMNTLGHLMERQQGVVKGLMGPWVHQYPHTAVPGPQIGFLQEAIRWWDCWLKGVDNGVAEDPAYRAYMLHSAPPDASAAHRKGHWICESQWPSPRVQREVLALSPGRLGGAGAALEQRVNTPQHLGLHTGEFFPMGLNAEMPGDQRFDDAMSVCFDTDPLPRGLDLLGQAVLHLRLRCDKPFALIAARLCDVAPDGASVRICHGILNLRHRDSMEHPTPVPVDAPFEIALTLDQMGYRLAPGHRLRLALSTTYWPFVWPSPEAATLVLEAGHLDLPRHSGSSGDEWQPPQPEAAAPGKYRQIRKGAASRRIEQDLLTGTVALVIEDDSGEAENIPHGLIFGETMREVWQIRPQDPLSAQVEISYEQRLARGDWSILTRAEAKMRATATGFVMTARLEAWDGETRVFDRDFSEIVKRDQV
ncbi:CocE/NonD family hydrolase [Gemmobacter fulvus]|uniref:CocE/NonD family hydrolase n=1 Tax=Gemmobacter fulvus TaxID=2840474 RepID=A0A975P7T4_9RHOB|nr:CocE/NonD family hydrolase [Gemmobacter fulvus]MBT9244264.1 CocE/NonD family hydrolase [Gemmobacter fulvus]QWK91155.1 CocE/NonD family hydrolase [Gemmobacter fulvus]